MIKYYLKTAWRNIIRNKFFSAINIIGLALGISCGLFILLWVQNEQSVDSFHKNGPNLYAVYTRVYNDNKVTGLYSTSGLLGAEVKKVIPEIKYATNFSANALSTFKVGDKIIRMNGSAADSDFFKMFSYPLLQGTAQAALNTRTSLAISRKMAVAFFGSAQEAMGKTIRYENRKDFAVTAVFEDLPENTSIKFDYLINWDTYLDDNPLANTWKRYAQLTYIQLRPDANSALVDKKLTYFMDNYNKDLVKGAYALELGLQRFDEVYLHGNFQDGKIVGGRIEYVHLFTIVAIFILLISCINFMNLSTARSVKRAKEIGVRKVIGAMRKALIVQFIGESLLYAVIAVVISLLLIICLLPSFNYVTQKQIGLPFAQGGFWIKLAMLTLITGIVAGSYPALFLSSFNPIKVLKGNAKVGSGVALLRKGLVVFQFILSIVFIIGTIIVSKQINFIQSSNLGYDRENLIGVPLEGDLFTKFDVFKDEALKMPGIKALTYVSTSLTDVQSITRHVEWDNKDPSKNVLFTYASVGYDFVPTMKLKILEGRDYSKAFLSDSVGYIINETALNKIGYTDPIGRRLTYREKTGKIVGVIKDFHFNSLHDEIAPLIITLWDKHQGIFGNGNALIRTQPGKTKEALASLQTLCRQMNPDFQFSYSFADDEFQKLYKNEQIVGNLAKTFAFLAITISCLGLLGLAMFTAEQRIKEIGIRKVLGASAGSLYALLSKEFLLLVIVALLIATPIAWYAMHQWLLNYAYRTSIQWWVFASSGAIAVLITLITVSFQSIKAALMNPVKSLRSE